MIKRLAMVACMTLLATGVSVGTALAPAIAAPASSSTTTKADVPLAGPTLNTSTDWMKDGRYGIMSHYLYGQSPGLTFDDSTWTDAHKATNWNTTLNAFNVTTYAANASAVGAKFVVFTLGQASGWYDSPNTTLDNLLIAQGYTARGTGQRDLVLDLANALQLKGIKLVLYFPLDAGNSDTEVRNALNGNTTSSPNDSYTAAFLTNTAAVVKEWSDRYGAKVSGWWFDGMWKADKLGYYDPAKGSSSVSTTALQNLRNAALSGNANSVMTVNDTWSAYYAAGYIDYFSGEQGGGGDQYPETEEGRWYDLRKPSAGQTPLTDWSKFVKSGVKVQGFSLVDMGQNWYQTGSPHYSTSADLMSKVRSVTELQRTIALNITTSADGSLDSTQYAQLQALNAFTASNIASTATVTASSALNSSNAATNIADGIIGNTGTGEWASNGETNPWITLTWPTAQAVNKITLYDRSDPTSNADGGTLTFSDGSQITVTGLSANGTGQDVTFATKNITSVKFQVANGSGTNVGLSEIEVFSTAQAIGTPLFATGFESADLQPTWTDTVISTQSANVNGFGNNSKSPESGVRTGETHHTGNSALMYSGNALGASSDYAYSKIYDLTTTPVTVGAATTLSYWIYPQNHSDYSTITGSNSTCVAVDLQFTDGTNLRDSGAVDQNGIQAHPAKQCTHLTLDTWNHLTVNLGTNNNTKTISRIDIGYDQPGSTDGYRGYIDDLSIQ